MGIKKTKKKARRKLAKAKVWQPPGPSLNKLKKKVRDARRLLEQPRPLQAEARAKTERALERYEKELTAVAEERKVQKMIKQYHMVRFFGELFFLFFLFLDMGMWHWALRHTGR